MDLNRLNVVVLLVNSSILRLSSFSAPIVFLDCLLNGFFYMLFMGPVFAKDTPVIGFNQKREGPEEFIFGALLVFSLKMMREEMGLILEVQ